MIWRKPPKLSSDAKGSSRVGQCDSPRTKGAIRQLWLWPVLAKVDPTDMLGTVIHEVTHASFWDIDEPAIQDFEEDLMRLLKRMKIKVSFGDV